jgi:phage terminase large subunit-like protein
MGARRRVKVPPRWVRTGADAAAIAAGYYFDRDAADHVCDFVEAFLKHSTGRWAAKPFVLEPWQRDFLSRLYGWMRPDGTRRFREAYLEVPKKNGKSTLFAAIALYGIFEEPGAEVYLGAMTRKQARIIFNECGRMVASSPALKKRLRVIDTTATITFAAANSKLEAMSTWSSTRSTASRAASSTT